MVVKEALQSQAQNTCRTAQPSTHSQVKAVTHLTVQISVQQHEGAGERVDCI